jgi:signal transduction histidine kinase
MRAQGGERRRIAQMLHETTAQDLGAVKMRLGRLGRTMVMSDADRIPRKKIEDLRAVGTANWLAELERHRSEIEHHL